MSLSLLAGGALTPLLSTFGYRRAGRPWRSALALGALAVALTVVGGIAFGFIYDFWITIEAGLCGETPVWAGVAAAVAFLVVGSWASLSPRRVWAWLFVTGAAIAAATLVAYFFGASHAYCET